MAIYSGFMWIYPAIKWWIFPRVVLNLKAQNIVSAAYQTAVGFPYFESNLCKTDFVKKWFQSKNCKYNDVILTEIHEI